MKFWFKFFFFAALVQTALFINTDYDIETSNILNENTQNSDTNISTKYNETAKNFNGNINRNDSEIISEGSKKSTAITSPLETNINLFENISFTTTETTIYKLTQNETEINNRSRENFESSTKENVSNLSTNNLLASTKKTNDKYSIINAKDVKITTQDWTKETFENQTTVVIKIKNESAATEPNESKTILNSSSKENLESSTEEIVSNVFTNALFTTDKSINKKVSTAKTKDIEIINKQKFQVKESAENSTTVTNKLITENSTVKTNELDTISTIENARTETSESETIFVSSTESASTSNEIVTIFMSSTTEDSSAERNESETNVRTETNESEIILISSTTESVNLLKNTTKKNFNSSTTKDSRSESNESEIFLISSTTDSASTLINEIDTMLNSLTSEDLISEDNVSGTTENARPETKESETILIALTTESASTQNDIQTMLNPLTTEDSRLESNETETKETFNLSTNESSPTEFVTEDPSTTPNSSLEFYLNPLLKRENPYSPSDSENSSTTSDSSSNSESEDGDTTQESTNQEITTKEPDPCEEAAVPELEVVPRNFSLEVEWSDPLPGCKFKYLIQCKSSETSSESEVINGTKYVIEELNACEEYTVILQRVYKNETNITSSSITSTTETIEPVEKLDTTYNPQENSLFIIWSLPTKVAKCLKKYILQFFKDDKLINKNDSYSENITYYDIDGCIDNKFVITAFSKNYKSEEKDIHYLELKKNDPPKYDEKNTEIHEDFVTTKWTFGDCICRPEKFEVDCTTENIKTFKVPGEFNIEKNELSATIENVEPYTNYSCVGIIINEAGASEPSRPGVFLTKSKPPETPQNLTVTEYSKEYLNIKWQPPKKWNGVPENYNISISHLGLNYNIPKSCIPSTFNPYIDDKIDVTETEYNFSTIIPASKYKITARAKSDGGWSKEIEKIIDLEEDIPEKPNMTINLLHSTSKVYNTSLNLTWKAPCKMNGVPANYKVILKWQKHNFVSGEMEEYIPPTEEEFYSHIFRNLKPDYLYYVQLFSQNIKYFGEPAEDRFLTPAGIPLKPKDTNLKAPNVSAVPDPWKSAIVYIRNDIFDKSMGDILYYAVIVAQKYCEEKPKYEYFHPETWPTVSSDNSSCKDENRAYEATEKKWNPFNFVIKSSPDYETYEYILGTDNCTELNCNKPLQPRSEYNVKIRGFTRNGFSDTKLLYFETHSLPDEVPVGLIIGLVVGILAIAFLIAGALFYTKGKLNFKNWPRMESVSQISPAPLPVSVKKFSLHYEKMIENPGKIKNEFQLLSTISSDITLSTKTASLPINKKKNRYINILPYDETRVKLDDNNANSSDYINASFIRGYSGSNEYIASQGPTEATCPAFWQMILEQNVKLIIMLTQFVESGKDKCYKYFPDLKEEYDLLNDVKIQCVEEEILNLYNKREFIVVKGNITKKVTHIQFNLWPDFGVPDEVHYMIDFWEAIKDIKMKRPSIILIHCSAGVGRTGTLVAIDILLQTIRDKRKVDIFGTVLNLRKQRMNMVQSEKQYEFLYKCVYYVINNNRLGTSPSRNLSQISESNML